MSEEIINYIIEEEEIDPKFIDVKLIQLLYENNFEKYFELTRLKYLSEKHREEIPKYINNMRETIKYLDKEETASTKEMEEINYKNLIKQQKISRISSIFNQINNIETRLKNENENIQKKLSKYN